MATPQQQVFTPIPTQQASGSSAATANIYSQAASQNVGAFGMDAGTLQALSGLGDSFLGYYKAKKTADLADAKHRAMLAVAEGATVYPEGEVARDNRFYQQTFREGAAQVQGEQYYQDILKNQQSIIDPAIQKSDYANDNKGAVTKEFEAQLQLQNKKLLQNIPLYIQQEPFFQEFKRKAKQSLEQSLFKRYALRIVKQKKELMINRARQRVATLSEAFPFDPPSNQIKVSGASRIRIKAKELWDFAESRNNGFSVTQNITLTGQALEARIRDTLYPIDGSPVTPEQLAQAEELLQIHNDSTMAHGSFASQLDPTHKTVAALGSRITEIIKGHQTATSKEEKTTSVEGLGNLTLGLFLDKYPNLAIALYAAKGLQGGELGSFAKTANSYFKNKTKTDAEGAAIELSRKQKLTIKEQSRLRTLQLKYPANTVIAGVVNAVLKTDSPAQTIYQKGDSSPFQKIEELNKLPATLETRGIITSLKAQQTEANNTAISKFIVKAFNGESISKGDYTSLLRRDGLSITQIKQIKNTYQQSTKRGGTTPEQKKKNFSSFFKHAQEAFTEKDSKAFKTRLDSLLKIPLKDFPLEKHVTAQKLLNQLSQIGTDFTTRSDFKTYVNPQTATPTAFTSRYIDGTTGRLNAEGQDFRDKLGVAQAKIFDTVFEAKSTQWDISNVQKDLLAKSTLNPEQVKNIELLADKMEKGTLTEVDRQNLESLLNHSNPQYNSVLTQTLSSELSKLRLLRAGELQRIQNQARTLNQASTKAARATIANDAFRTLNFLQENFTILPEENIKQSITALENAMPFLPLGQRKAAKQIITATRKKERPAWARKAMEYFHSKMKQPQVATQEEKRKREEQTLNYLHKVKAYFTEAKNQSFALALPPSAWGENYFKPAFEDFSKSSLVQETPQPNQERGQTLNANQLNFGNRLFK